MVDAESIADKLVDDMASTMDDWRVRQFAPDIAAALRAAYTAGLEDAARAVREQRYPQGGQNDEWHGAMLMRDYCEGAIRALAETGGR